MNENLEKIELSEEEIAKSKKWFCTIFNKKNNRAITTFKTIWEFTENNARSYGIINWLLGDTSKMKKEDKDEMIKDLNNFVYNRLDKEKDKVDIAAMTEMFKMFDEKYRILIGK